MKVIFTTCIDHYNRLNCFPENFDSVPSFGHKVNVRSEVCSYFKEKRLPTSLEVVNITWEERKGDIAGSYKTVAMVELHYDALSIKAAELSGVKLF